MAEYNRNTSETGNGANRLPIGLTAAMVALAFSLGAMLIAHNVWPNARFLELLVHVSAVLCLAWGLGVYALQRGPATGSTGKHHDIVLAVQVTQLVLGLLVAIVMLYLGMTAVLARLYQPYIQVAIWPTGMLDVSAVAIAALLAWWLTGNGALMTCLMWLLVLMSLWSALLIPVFEIREVHGIPREIPLDWISPFALGAAFVVAGFTVLTGVVAHRRRVASWPDNLEDLVTPTPRWPGFEYSAGIMAAMVLILGCISVVSPLTPIAALMAGVSMLTLAARHWNENLADSGFGLITLCVVSLFVVGADDSMNRADYFAAIFGRALLGLGIMTGFWHWLAAVWHQQLDNGRAWTTAGRLIRVCRRVGFIMGAAGVFVAFALALWPMLKSVYTSDNSAARWAWGLIGNVVLIAALTRSARHTGKATLAWLAVFALIACCTFSLVRLSHTMLYSAFLEYWPLLIAILAGVAVLLARILRHADSWRPFFEPAYALGVLVNPVTAIFGVGYGISNSIPRWTESATFAVLAIVFLLAGLLLGPRRFTILTAVCGVAAIFKLA